MPLKLVPPQKGRSSLYRVRGTHLGIYLDRSTKSADRNVARKLLLKWKEEIERGELSNRREMTFAEATLSYTRGGGEVRFLKPIVNHFGPNTLVRDLSQATIDAAAHELYPDASPATRNRQFYTPVSAILKHAGHDHAIKRPKGAQGNARTDWMTPEDAKRILKAARDIDPEFAVFLATLLATGMRLSDLLNMECKRVTLSESFAYIPRTKNDDPRPVHLPPAAVAALASHPRGLDRDGRVFRFRKNGYLYTLMKKVKKKAGADLGWIKFHTFCHTWATWMRRYAGLDTKGLVATGRWLDLKSASRYEHVVTSEEARRADLLPITWDDAKKGGAK